MLSRELRHSPIARIFRKYTHEIHANLENSVDILAQPTNFEKNITHKNRVSLKPMFDLAIEEEITILERWLVFLATTVSVSPFLGLLGTVWGIMTAFMSMGIKGSAEIAAVGPGIAEALITTIAGLAVAIPALVAYNIFVNKLRSIEKEVTNFFTNLLLTIEKEKML
ncbi:MAG: MotA/TolQ/ExbB proton channel family protein [bacterium]|nr:MotA/TolQ/ExbB proton channel family protein [bacterium]